MSFTALLGWYGLRGNECVVVRFRLLVSGWGNTPSSARVNYAVIIFKSTFDFFLAKKRQAYETLTTWRRAIERGRWLQQTRSGGRVHIRQGRIRRQATGRQHYAISALRWKVGISA